LSVALSNEFTREALGDARVDYETRMTFVKRVTDYVQSAATGSVPLSTLRS
jgi:hypothetical protein